MTDKTLSILAIIVGVIFLAFVRWNKTNLTDAQKSRRGVIMTMGFLWLLGGIALLSFSISK